MLKGFMRLLTRIQFLQTFPELSDLSVLSPACWHQC
nr:MAG TPA: hypothetical protein [Caudoviricetes sp.]